MSSAANVEAAADQLLTTRELMSRTTLSRSTISRLSLKDDVFRRAMVRFSSTRIAWRERVIAEWMASRS